MSPTKDPLEGARVAVLVYNDCHNDARVLKESATLAAAGAVVRIFAVARARAGHGEGLSTLAGGVTLSRGPEFDLARMAPRFARVTRRLLNRPAAPPIAAPAARTAPSPSTAGQPAPPSQPGLARGVASGLGAITRDVWLRTYNVASLGVYWRATARDAIRWKPDIVHANDGNTLAPALRISRATGAPIIYDSHELWRRRNVRTDRPIARVVEAVVERRGIRRAAGVITVSPSIATWLKNRYKLPAIPSLVRNIPAAGPAPDPEKGQLRELAGLGADSKVIAYSGRITTSRGIEETLGALAVLPPEVHLVMLGYGSPDYVEEIWALARSLGVSERMHIVGPVAPEEVADAMSDGDVAVVLVRPTCLSYRFALPNKLFEAIRGGLPVAAADLPDIRALVEGLGVGEIFPDSSPDSLAATISRVLADPAPYRAHALQAAEELTWEREAEHMLALYRTALRERL